MTGSTSERPRATLLVLIGLFKLVKAVLLIAVGIGAIQLIGKDASRVVVSWMQQMNVDPENRVIHAVLDKLPALSTKQLEALSAGTFVYAALFLAEGIGLLLRKRWAEYLTIVVTALLLAPEIYELVEKVTAVRMGVLVLNLAILAYLIVRVRATRTKAHAAA